MDPKLYRQLKAMTRRERGLEFERITGQPATPKWEYENPVGEAELAKRAAQEKSNE
jgi:hypothetical protein